MLRWRDVFCILACLLLAPAIGAHVAGQEGRPGAPLKLLATPLSDTLIHLTWNPPTTIGNSSISGYKIEVSSDGGNNWTDLVANTNSGSPQYKHFPLAPNTTRHYRVSAINNQGTGPASNIASGTTPATGTPGQPTTLRVSAVGRTIQLLWILPPDPGTSAITGHRIEVSSDAGANWTDLVANTDTIGPSYVHKGLSIGDTRHYRVSAINSSGPGPASTVRSATVGATPSVPRNPAATANGDTVTVSWEVPADVGGSEITAYYIGWSDTGFLWYSTAADSLVPTLFKQSVPRGITRHYRVGAANGAGFSGWSSVVQTTTEKLSGPPGASRNFAVTALELTGTMGTIRLSWEAPADTGTSAITEYRIERYQRGSWTTATVDGATMTWSDTRLQASITVRYRVLAVNGSGSGPPTKELDGTVPTYGTPTAPTGLSATADGASKVDLSWSEPPDTGRSAITGYRIEVWSEAMFRWLDLVNNTVRTATDYAHTGLEPGTTQRYRVSAVNGHGPGPASNIDDATTSSSGGPKPGAPGNLVATVDGDSAIDLSWSEPATTGASSITGYKIEVLSDDAGSSWTDLEKNTGTTDTKYRHSPLKPNTTWHYRVSAINNQGTGPASNVARGTTAAAAGAPSAPGNLVAAPDGDSAIDLSWNAPADTGTSAVTGYQVEVSSDAGSSWTDLEKNTGTTDTKYRHSPLKPGTTWHYRVSAINDQDTGPASNVARGTTTGTGVPNPPRNLTAEVNDNLIELNWDRPTSVGTATVTYSIRVNDGTGWVDLVEQEDDLTVTEYEHRDVKSETTYRYRVYAHTDGGRSSAATVTTTTGAGDKPGAPLNLEATVRGSSEIELSWDVPTDRGSTPITSYRIEYSTDAGSSWSVLVAETSSTSTSYRHRDLQPNQTYHYRVSASNSAGRGPVSNAASARTTGSRPTAPYDLVAVPNGPNRVDLTWSAPDDDGGSPITGYRIEASRNDDAWTNLEESTESRSTKYSHTGLTPGDEWRYRVYAINAIGESRRSNTAIASTASEKASMPTNLTAVSAGTSVINLSWTEPADDGGAEITGYQIEVSSGSLAGWVILTPNTESTSTSYSHTGLGPGTTYHYRVSAVNSAGTSSPSSPASATTDASVPDAPTDLTATANGAHQIDLTWTAPEYDGGAEIMGYKIEAFSVGSQWSVVAANTESRSTRYSHSGLDPVTTMTYRVSAINRAGTGDPSEMATATTEATIPDPPTNLTATSRGVSQIDLAWQAPDYSGGAPITGYQIEVSENAGASWVILVDDTRSAKTIYPHTGLPPASTRHYRVSAINTAGASEPSRVAYATTDATVPDEPTELKAVAQDHSQINVSWDAPEFDGGSRITGYQIEFSKNGGATWFGLEDNTGSTNTKHEHSGLQPATTYHYRVSAINKIGVSGASRIAGATTHATVPGRPINLTATAVAPTRIDLKWDRPEYDGGAAVSAYRIEVSGDNSAWIDLEASTGTSDTEYSHTGLTPGSTYYYRVSAMNIAGVGLPSDVASASTDDPVDRAARANNAILPRFAAAATSSTLSAIATRIEAVAAGQPQAGELSGLLQSGSAYSRSIGEGTALWGGADFTSMSESGKGVIAWDGVTKSLHAGTDIQLPHGILAGISTSRSLGSYDFTDATGDRGIEGTYEAGLMSFNPYAAWIPRRGSVVWAAGIAGWGDITVEDGLAGARQSNSRIKTAAAGGSTVLLSSVTSSLDLRTEGWISRVSLDGNTEVDSLSIEMRRVRLLVEWAQTNTLDGGHSVEVLLNGGMRYDSNDAMKSTTGVEFSGGIRYLSPSSRVRMEGHGRMLATSESGYREWGIRGMIQVDPKDKGQGLSLRISPTWGVTARSVEDLWENGVLSEAAHMSGAGRVKAAAEYGIPAFSGVPVGHLYLGPSGSHAFGTGMKYRFSETFDLQVEGVRKGANNGLNVRGLWKF